MAPNPPGIPSRTSIPRISRSFHQTRKLNPQRERQLLPQQISPESRYINSPSNRPSYYIPLLTTPRPVFLSNQFKQDSPGIVVYPSVAGSCPPIVLQPPTCYTTDGNLGHNLPGFAEECLYMSAYSNNVNSIDLNTPTSDPSSDVRYEEADIASNAARIDDEHSSNTLWNLSAGNYGEAHSSLLYNSHNHKCGGNTTKHQTLHNDPAELGRDGFLTLPGYLGYMNCYQRFDCFEHCKQRRFGKKGFGRRANMLAHLRSCHGQEILRGSRVKPRRRGISFE